MKCIYIILLPDNAPASLSRDAQWKQTNATPFALYVKFAKHKGTKIKGSPFMFTRERLLYFSIKREKKSLLCEENENN